MALIDFFFGKQVKEIKKQVAQEATSKIVRQVKNFYNNYNNSQLGGAKYPYGLSSSGSGVFLNHYEIMQNARRAVFDSTQAKALVDRFAESIIDIGLKLEAIPSYEILGIAPEQAEEWGRDVSQRFHLYAKSKDQHRAGLINFYQAQLMYAKFQQRDNDIFVRFFYSANKKLLNPLQFEFIDPVQLRGSEYTTSYYNGPYEDGIKRNPDGTERAYSIWIHDEKYQYKEVEVLRIGPKSGKIMMIHGFQPEYAQQGRGYSRLAHALQEFQHITDLSLAKIKHAINQSQIIAGIENQQQDPSTAGLDSMLTDRGAGAAQEQPVEEHAAAVVQDLGDRFVYKKLPELTSTDPGSTILMGLQQGDQWRLYEPKTGGDTYEEFINTFVSHLSASTGMPIEMLLMKFNANYSASRATLVIFWRICQIWREEMATDWMDVHYESWLGEEIAAGRIQAPGWSDPILRAAWCNNNWIGAPMPNIDPAKEAKAAKDNLEISATTQNRYARDLNGSSAKDNIAINRRMFEETPKPPWSGNGGADNIGDNENNQEDENNGSTGN